MTKIFFQVLLFNALLIGNVLAVGESGFLRQGKKHVVYRDGIKVGKTFAESYQQRDERADRSIASDSEVKPQVIFYVKDDNRHCYYSKDSGKATDLSCVK